MNPRDVFFHTAPVASGALSTDGELMRVYEQVRGEGVNRPFRVLCLMAADLRSELASLLGVVFRRPGEVIVESWEIIHKNLRGLQARTHSLPEKVSPLSRNNSWPEILQRTAARLGLRLDFDASPKRLEKAIFEHVSRTFLEGSSAEEIRAIEEHTEKAPHLYYCLASCGISTNGISLFFAGLARAAVGDGWSTPEGIAKASAWINDRAMASASWIPSVSLGLSAVKAMHRDALRGWRESGRFDRLFRGQERRTLPVLAAIYLEGELDENLANLKLLPEGN